MEEARQHRASADSATQRRRPGKGWAVQKRIAYGLAAGAAAALVLGACSNTATDTQASSSASSAVSSAPPSTDDNRAAHNDADVSFAQNMIPHHQQAIEMCDMLRGKQDIDPQVSALATQIKNAQGPEISTMQAWLEQWGVSSTAEPGGMPGHDMSGGDMSEMPHMSGMGDMGGGHGMMSDADMAALEKAQGAEASRLFLTQMIEHHKGAITMAQQEIDKGQFPDAVEMARNIVSSQQKEIATMQEMLEK